jgi:hypothetical protein
MSFTVTVTPGYTFTSTTDPVTIAKLNSLGEPTVELTGSVSAASISANSVGTTAIIDSSITHDKMADDAIGADEIIDASITTTECDPSVYNGISVYAAGTYAADTLPACKYAVDLTPNGATYTAGMVVRFKASAANTGATDIYLDAQAEVNLLKNYNQELVANDIVANQVVTAVYDGAAFQMVSPVAPRDTKILQWGTEADPATLATINPPSAGTVYKVAHGFLTIPRQCRVVLRCNATDAGYAQDDEVDLHGIELISSTDATITIPTAAGGGDHCPLAVSVNATHARIACGRAGPSTANWYVMSPADATKLYKMTATKWDIYAYVSP